MNPLELVFPNLAGTNYRITSPSDDVYNCLAWAASENDRWWWPDPFGASYWPPGVPRSETLEAFLAAYATLGFAPAADESLHREFEKVAIYTKSGKPTHAARQLPTGNWTSKLGRAEDIEHTLAALTGEVYGSVTQLLQRPRSGGSGPAQSAE